jgi:AraC family transcriptional regulator
LISYIQIIQETVDYIEENLAEPLQVKDLSQNSYLSEFHFNRLFKSVVGLSPKQYVLRRKMAVAQSRLASSNDSLIQIAYDLGFEYPEVFSRAFKKQFGISPQYYRVSKPDVPAAPKAEVIARELMNYQGSLVAKAEFVERPTLALEGLQCEVNLSRPGYEDTLRLLGKRFETASVGMAHLNFNRFFSVVNCQGREDDWYDVFIGRESLASGALKKLDLRQVPGGWYACFDYQGDMLDIRSTFVDDLFRWILIKDIRLNPNGVGMLTQYEDQTYFTSQQVKIFVPVILENDPVQQKTS